MRITKIYVVVKAMGRRAEDGTVRDTNIYRKRGDWRQQGVLRTSHLRSRK